MQFLTMELGVLTVLLFVGIADASDEYHLVNWLRFNTTKVDITAEGRNYIDGTVEQSDQFIKDVKLLQPLDKNATVYFQLDMSSDRWKGGGAPFCSSEESLVGSMAKIMRGSLNAEERDCPITELPDGNTSGEFTRDNIYMPISLANYLFTVSLSLVDERGNRLVHVTANASSF